MVKESMKLKRHDSAFQQKKDILSGVWRW